MLIQREIMSYIRSILERKPVGIILSGIVGCGKTTLIEQILSKLSDQDSVFRFTGDDTYFRSQLHLNSRHITDTIRSKTQKRPFIFVDEVQKSEDIFDAIKIAFDELGATFIISGSNPDFLDTVARKRLQRRAHAITLYPFSLPEILSHLGLIDIEESSNELKRILFEKKTCEVKNLQLTLSKKIESVYEKYLCIGGLPLAWLAKNEKEAMQQIQLTIERGFDPLLKDTNNISDVIKIYLAENHSREFTYQGLFQKIALRSRDTVNGVINELIHHGYLLSKKPLFVDENRKSYLINYSWIDPGIISYLNSFPQSDSEKGFRVEGIIQTRLMHHLEQEPTTNELGYYKPYVVDVNNKTKFLPGEIDFLLKIYRRIIPMEVKLTSEIKNIDTNLLTRFIGRYKTPFGIIFYGGVPFADKHKKIIYWPWWLV